MKKRIWGFLLAAVMLLNLLPQLTTESKAHEIVMTADEFVDCLWTAYNRPNVYKNVFPYNLGYYDGSVIYFDCWNLGKAIIWTKGDIVNNYTVGHHATMDTSCGLGDWDGLSIVMEAPNFGSDFSDLVPGEWLYKENHTGYYVGNGQVIECTAGWNVWGITISQIDQYGNRSRNGVSGGRWLYHGMVPWLDYNASNDTEEPVISDVQYSEVSASGYTISCKVTDNGSIKRVSFPTWTEANGQDDLPEQFMATQLGTRNGDRYTFRVNASEHNNETGAYITHIYAEDRRGNIGKLELNAVEVRNDHQKPVVSDVRISELSSAGYTVSCKVTDDWGVNSVSFPSWTVENGQDDLPEQFLTTQLGLRDGDRFIFRVSAAAHNNETGEYATHIYATDCAGNQISYEMDFVNVMDDHEDPVISNVEVTDITETGYTVTCTVTDNWGLNSVVFPTWTEENGQDDLDQNFIFTQMGEKDGDTYTFRVEAADHNQELGLYNTHIYATDCADNRVCVELLVEVGKEPEKIKQFEEHQYTLENGFVYGVTDRTSVNLLLSDFENENLEVLDCQGNAITGVAVVGTGTKINLYENGKLVDTATVVVRGDLDGNGIADTTDYMRIKAFLRGGFELNEEQNKAADVDGSGKINTTDYMRLKAYFVGTYNLFA